MIEPPSASESAAARPTTNLQLAATLALGWVVLFTVAHVYWYLGGRIGLGDAPDPLPAVPDTAQGWIFRQCGRGHVVAGIALPLRLLWSTGPQVPRRLLLALLWAGCAALVLRGAAGLADDLVRVLGNSEGGLTGLSNQQILGQSNPSTYTVWSGVIINAYFLLGGLLFGALARRAGRTRHTGGAVRAVSHRNRRRHE